eukprot:jgi/Orpsp1_1/1192127/evm.model.d7180000090783.1
MKFVGSFIFLALLNLVTVFAGPLRPYVFVDDTIFEYYISTDGSQIATIIHVMNNEAKELTIQPYAYYEGQRYNVVGAMDCFTNSKVEKIIIHESMTHSFHFYDTVLGQAKRLRTLQVDASNFEIREGTFDNVSSSIKIQGKGVDNMMIKYAKSLLQKNNITIKNYSSSTSDYERQQNLYELGRFVKQNFKFTTSVAYPSNGANALIFKKGDTIGLSRAFRILCRARGFAYDDVHVGTDGIHFGWNFINLHKHWYNFDIVHTTFRNGMGDVSKFYKDQDFINKVLVPAYNQYGDGIPDLNPSKWSIYLDQYGYQDEISSSRIENFDSWLKRRRLGVRM